MQAEALTHLNRIPVDLVPAILKHVAREDDRPTINALVDPLVVSMGLINDYWLATCREISNRPYLPLCPNVNYAWVYEILTSVSGGVCRQFERWGTYQHQQEIKPAWYYRASRGNTSMRALCSFLCGAPCTTRSPDSFVWIVGDVRCYAV